MSAITVTVDRSSYKEDESRRELLVSLSRIMAIAYCAIGAIYALLWLLYPSVSDTINILSMAILVGISVASAGIARSNQLNTAAYLQIGGLVAVVTVASAATEVALPGSSSHATAGVVGVVTSVNYAVAVVLGGLVLRRHQVIGLTALIVGILALHALANWAAGRNPVSPLEVDALQANLAAVLGLILLLSVLASEYSTRLRSTLAQLEARAKEAERHAWELERAKAEIEFKVAELAAAKQEIENRTLVSVGVASEIRTMAKELATTSSEQVSGSSEQAAAMGEIVATMEELSRAAIQIAANSAQVSQQAASALRTAEMGREAVEETIAGLDRIRAEVRSVAEKNLTLGQKTQAIGEIIEVITEIADRTHLLALNAAIESAAAGEYGRRFSVVASQVKELASEAKSAARQVRAAVAEIQRAASATVLAAEKSEADVEVGAGLGRGAGEAIGQIVDTVQEVAAAAKEMLLATQQQQSASEQVVSTIRQIEQVTRESAAGSRQISQAVGQLTAAAERLR